jgi:hypothetical protein
MKVILEWKYEPRDYFEAPIEVVRDDYVLRISDGAVSAEVAASVYDSRPAMRDDLHSEVQSRLQAVALLDHRKHKLSESSETRVRPDGSKLVSVSVEPATARAGGPRADIVVRDPSGNVTYDSKQARIDEKRAVADLAAKHGASDATAGAILQSYSAATADPSNELVHLYEVRDALARRYGGESNARSALGIDSRGWSDLGRLCNHEPLRQGRHRGRSAGELRDATHEELTKARRLCAEMITAYLRALEVAGDE